MSKRRTITKVAMASAVSIGALGATAATAASAATTRAARIVARGTVASPAVTRVTEDAPWRMTREVTSAGASARVVFYATDLRTGRRFTLN